MSWTGLAQSRTPPLPINKDPRREFRWMPQEIRNFILGNQMWGPSEISLPGDGQVRRFWKFATPQAGPRLLVVGGIGPTVNQDALTLSFFNFVKYLRGRVSLPSDPADTPYTMLWMTQEGHTLWGWSTYCFLGPCFIAAYNMQPLLDYSVYGHLIRRRFDQSIDAGVDIPADLYLAVAVELPRNKLQVNFSATVAGTAAVLAPTFGDSTLTGTWYDEDVSKLNRSTRSLIAQLMTAMAVKAPRFLSSNLVVQEPTADEE